ncbi:MAG: hypothetical protein R2838_19050 [Caldilineaceae bacterium]
MTHEHWTLRRELFSRRLRWSSALPAVVVVDVGGVRQLPDPHRRPRKKTQPLRRRNRSAKRL